VGKKRKHKWCSPMIHEARGYSRTLTYLSRDSLDVPPRSKAAIREKRVVKAHVNGRDFTFFKGKDRDYFLIRRLFCTCKDFEFNVVLRRKKLACYHLIATEVAERESAIKELRLSADEFYDIMYEIVLNGRSNILRKLLLKRR